MVRVCPFDRKHASKGLPLTPLDVFSVERNMSTRTAKALTWAGGLTGMLGVAAMAVGFKITLTPEMQEVLFYKGLFAASAVLLILGAIIGRRGHRQKERERASRELPPPSEIPLSGDPALSRDSVRSEP
jgi:hypothetical protein